MVISTLIRSTLVCTVLTGLLLGCTPFSDMHLMSLPAFHADGFRTSDDITIPPETRILVYVIPPEQAVNQAASQWTEKATHTVIDAFQKHFLYVSRYSYQEMNSDTPAVLLTLQALDWFDESLPCQQGPECMAAYFESLSLTMMVRLQDQASGEIISQATLVLNKSIKETLPVESWSSDRSSSLFNAFLIMAKRLSA